MNKRLTVIVLGLFLSVSAAATPLTVQITAPPLVSVGNAQGTDHTFTVTLANPAGEWNRAVIICKGSIVSLSLNGDRVVPPVNLDLYTEPNTNIDGTKNKFNTPLKDFPRTGRIGFQQHGGNVWFRNIKIKTL